ncbi:hypothetical protein GCM10027068_13740 [Prescottella soli]
MEPVECDRCGTCVLVEKNSWHHTSIQWRTDPQTACEADRANPELLQRGVWVGSCPPLRDSIRRAAIDGRLTVPD